ncbi:MAG: hypothetical protein QXV32_06545 [Conexivisphaerales archaeon]
MSGPDYELARKEILSLLECYGISSNVEIIDEKIVVLETPELPEQVFARLALTREVGRVFDILHSNDELLASASNIRFEHGQTFKVDSIGFDGSEKLKIDSEVGETICGNGYTVRLEHPDNVVRIIKAETCLLVGRVIGVAKRRWVDRRPRARPFFHPSALHPKLARLLVNLSKVKEGEVLLDPLAGTGSILIEGAVIGAYSIGLELSKKMVEGCMKNLENFAKDDSEIVMADARMMPIRRADAIATDLPYGRSSSVLGIDRSELRVSLMKEAKRVLKSRDICLMMSPSKELPSEDVDLALQYRHDLYVHRNLTRTISVFRRR